MPPETTPSTPPPRPTRRPLAAPSASVLVVDADAQARAVALSAIRAAGHEAYGVASGEEAIALARGGVWDVVLFDTRTRAFGGALVDELRDRVRPLPTLVCAAPPEEAKAFCEGMGVPVFVAKPFEPSSLQRAIDAAAELAWETRSTRREPRSGTQRIARPACVVVVGEFGGEDGLREALPPSLRHARIALVATPEEAERVLDMIVPDLLILDDVEAHERLRALATARAVPVIVRGMLARARAREA